MALVPLYNPQIVDFNSTIAAASNATFSAKIDADTKFWVEAIQGTLFTPALVLSTTIAGTPFPREASTSPGTTGNSFPSMAHFRIQINTANNDWFSVPVRCNLLFGSGERQHILTKPRAIGQGQDLRITLFNDCTATFGVQGQIMFEGYKMVPQGSANT